jgi:hypothetical protein
MTLPRTETMTPLFNEPVMLVMPHVCIPQCSAERQTWRFYLGPMRQLMITAANTQCAGAKLHHATRSE